MPKRQKPNLEGYTSLQDTLQKAKDYVDAAQVLGRALLDGAEKFRNECETTMQRHLARTDLRPHVKAAKGKVSTIAFNDAIYEYWQGKDEGLDYIPWHWRDRTDVAKFIYTCQSKHDALLAIILDYCNGGLDNAAVSDLQPNSTHGG